MRTGRRCSPPRQSKLARGSLAVVGRAWRGEAPSLATVAGRGRRERRSCADRGSLAALCLVIGSACGPLSEGTETSGAATEVAGSSSTGGSAAETSGPATTGATDAPTTEMTTMTGSTMTGSTMTGSTGPTSEGSTEATDTEATDTGATDTEATGGSTTGPTGTGADSEGSTGDGSGGETGDGLSFAAEIFPLFVVHCSCHKVSYPDAETTFAALVGQPSMGVPELTLVVPYDVDGSYLLHKLNNTQLEVGGLGAQMPPKMPLSPEELDLFDLWVSEGAAP